MYNIGLKLWSINTSKYFEEAELLWKERFIGYIELYFVPKSLDTLNIWKTLDVPYVIHCPHFGNGFNLANKEKYLSNLAIYKEVKVFADELNSQDIIFHGGIDGCIEETVIQLESFKESRVIIENKPKLAIPNRMGGNFCRGFNIDEIIYVKNNLNCRFCLDIGHAICSANAQNINKYDYINKFIIDCNPSMFHLTDLSTADSVYDSHIHLGKGKLDLFKIFNLIPDNSKITIETEKLYKDSLRDFREDLNFIHEVKNA